MSPAEARQRFRRTWSARPIEPRAVFATLVLLRSSSVDLFDTGAFIFPISALGLTCPGTEIPAEMVAVDATSDNGSSHDDATGTATATNALQTTNSGISTWKTKGARLLWHALLVGIYLTVCSPFYARITAMAGPPPRSMMIMVPSCRSITERSFSSSSSNNSFSCGEVL